MRFSDAPTVSETLIAFMREQVRAGVPERVLHEAKRLLLNQLKAAVGATTHDAVRVLHEWARASPGTGAHALWFGTELAPDRACVVNGALFEVLDFNDTYIPTFLHATSSVLPPVLALAESGGYGGHEVLTALALGIEVELAIATILMPTGYYRGFLPGGLVGGVGAAAACSLLSGLDDTRMRNAIGLAMCSAFGTYESVGSMALPYLVGFTARSGFTAFEMARLGLDAPPTAFEGERGMLACYSNEKPEKTAPVLASLGQEWRIFGQSYKTVPTETITHAPIELVLEILARAGGRVVKRMRFGVEQIVVKIVRERMERFGDPSSELTARFDLCYCAAAAWVRGRFTLAEMREAAYRDPAILDLRGRIELVADPSHPTFDGASLEVEFADGSIERARVDDFLGSPGRRMSDDQLSDVFRAASEALLAEGQADRILEATWALDRAPGIAGLISLLKLR